MTIENGYSNGRWKKSLKTSLALSIGIVTANFVDPSHVVWTWLWMKHILIAAGCTFLMNELGYFENWLKMNGN